MSTKVFLSESDRQLFRSLMSCIVANVKNTEAIDMIAGITAPALPHSIANGEFQSYTIITTGVVTIDGVSVPEGTYTWSAPNNGTLSGKTLAGAGSVIITSTKRP